MTKEQLLEGITIPVPMTEEFLVHFFNVNEHDVFIEQRTREIDGRNSTLEGIFNDWIDSITTE